MKYPSELTDKQWEIKRAFRHWKVWQEQEIQY